MKHSGSKIHPAFAIFLLSIALCFVTVNVKGQQVYANDQIEIPQDSIQLSLLTCSPRNQVYTLYGHTALRYRNFATDEDWVFNYGVFNFKKSFFILRFVFGLTDYELGVMPFPYFLYAYKNEGYKVTEQIINLTTEEKKRLSLSLANNYRPENRIYRYNFLYDNCTTRARDIIERSLNGRISYNTPGHNDTYRKLLHSKTANFPWSQLGNDLCLGIKADLKISNRERQFLPEILMEDLNHATIVDGNQQRPLVLSKSELFDTSRPANGDISFATPRFFAIVILIISIAIAFIETKRKNTFKYWDAFLMATTGIAGLVITVLLFSQHPTTSTNLQILLFNPIPIIFIPQILKRNPTKYWRTSAILLLLFCLGAFFQDYADGTIILALCLFIRCWINKKYPAQQPSK